jgi:hypothetical protein
LEEDKSLHQNRGDNLYSKGLKKRKEDPRRKGERVVEKTKKTKYGNGNRADKRKERIRGKGGKSG